MNFPLHSPACLQTPAALRALGYSLRQASNRDVAWMQSLFIAERRQTFAAAGLPEAMWRPLLLQQFELQHRQYTGLHPQACFMVLEQGASPVGRYYVDASGAEVHVLDVLLAHAWRNQGLGRHLLEAALRHASTHGRITTLMVDPHNHPAWHLYRSLGFEPQAATATHIQMVCKPAMAVS